MGPSYERELRLLPVLLDMERRGVAIDLDRLRTDIERYQRALAKAEGWVRERIGAEAEVNLDSGPQLIAALDRAGLVDKSKLGTTEKTGKLSSAKASIDAAVTDRTLAATLRYVGALRTCLSTFLLPWERTAAASGGRIFTSWNQTRGNGGGARTGRLSSSPNFQNIPVEFNDFFANDAPMIALPPLPLCRTYITAYPGHTLLGRDYNSQELRILAHFEDGEMLDRYIEDPGIDIHQYAADMVSKFTGRKISRKVAKAIDFGILYGAGAINLSRQLNCSVGEASSLLNAFHKAFPGVKRLQRALQFRAATKQPVRTVGGRLYHVEPPIDGKEFSYKLVNTIIQGSAADQTKDAMIAIHERAGPGKLILSVHDEIVLSVPQDTAEDDMAIMRVIMNTSPIDTPMKSEGEVGHNWAEMHKHA
jgi:DNA polymerase-1